MAIDALLVRACDGSGGSLLIEGEPGVGKTALLEGARESAAGMRQLRVTGLEAESSLPFSALTVLTEGLLDRLGELPPPQAAAVEGALALAADVPADRFAACAGFLGLLTRAAEREPVLVVVDDAQWLDRASGQCLGYAARRLSNAPIALLAACRAGTSHPFVGARIDRIVLSGLDREAARTVLERSEPALPRSVADSLIEAAAGNPLALIELPALLSPRQRRGEEPLARPMPPGPTLQRAFERRIAELPVAAARSCLVASAAFSSALAPIVAACESLGLAPSALAEAEEHGIVALDVDRVRFTHPLLRGAVYEGAKPGERREAHRVLAAVAPDRDSRAWHLAGAAVGPDERVAGALEDAAGRAVGRGGYAAAADALERAARLTPDPRSRARRLLAAGIDAAIGGAYDRGMALMELAEGIDDPALRAAVRHPLALATLNGGERSATETRLALAAEARRIEDLDPVRAAAMHADSGMTAAIAGDCRGLLEAAEHAAGLLPADAPATERSQVLAMLGLGQALSGRVEEARVVLGPVAALLDEVDPLSPAAQSIAFALGARRCTGDDRLLLEEIATFEAAARAAAAIGLYPYYEVMKADVAFRLGDWGMAAADVEAAIEGAEESGQLGSLVMALVIAARLYAARGEERAAREAVARSVELAAGPGYANPFGWGRAAIGFLELSLDRPEEAIAELEVVEKALAAGGLEEPLIIPWAPDLVEAYARVGRRGDAERVTAKLLAQAELSGTPLAAALAARCRGLVAEDPFVELERALELHERADSPFERARTMLILGSRLHRARRRGEARDRLREALETFEQLEARPWAARTRAELKAAGAVERRRVADPDELTAQEVRVATAVATGATNREVAASLYLSPKTIEFHLGRVYRKLGIHSRAELATIVAAGGLAPGSPADAGTTVGGGSRAAGG